MTALFVFIESRAAAPVMPLEIYKNGVVAVSVAVSFFLGFGLYSLLLFLPLFVYVVLDASSTAGGALLASMVVGIVLGALVSGRLLSRASPRYRFHALAGTAMLTAGVFLLSSMNGSTVYGAVAAATLGAGFGVGVTMTAITVVVQNSVPREHLGTATSALQFFRNVSGVLGMAVLGLLYRERFSLSLDENLTAAVRETLPPGRIEEIKRNPLDYVNAEGDGKTAELAGALTEPINAALANATSHVFLVGASVLVLAVLVSLFLRSRASAEE